MRLPPDVQVCTGWRITKDSEAALTALLLCAEPWYRRRPVAVACYSDVWEWVA
jgi:hypothetical protein